MSTFSMILLQLHQNTLRYTKFTIQNIRNLHGSETYKNVRDSPFERSETYKNVRDSPFERSETHKKRQRLTIRKVRNLQKTSETYKENKPLRQKLINTLETDQRQKLINVRN